VPRQHRGHLDDAGEQQPRGHGGHPGERRLHQWEGAVALVQHAQRDHQEARPAQEPSHGGGSARPAGAAIPHHHGHIEDVGPGQELPECQEVHKLLLGEPVPAFDQHAARPEHHAAEARQGNLGEGEEQGPRGDVGPVCGGYVMRQW